MVRTTGRVVIGANRLNTEQGIFWDKKRQNQAGEAGAMMLISKRTSRDAETVGFRCRHGWFCSAEVR